MAGLADYEAWQAKREQSKVGAASLVVISQEQTPDQVAGDLNLASEYGRVTGQPVPPAPMVNEYRSVFQAAIDKKRAETILTSSPRLTEWLRNPENAGVSRDDLDGLSWWETGFGAAWNATKRGSMRAGPQFYNQAQANRYARQARDANLSFGEIVYDERQPIYNAEGQEVDRLLPGPSDAVGAGYRFIASRLTNLWGNTAEENAAQYQQAAGEVAKRISEIPMSPGGEAGKKLFLEASKAEGWEAQLAALANAFAQSPGDMTSFLMQTAAESIPSMTAALGVGLATRNPTAAATAMGGTSFASEYGSSPVEFFNEKGIDVSTPEGAIRAISDPVLMREAEQRGIARGVVIGVLDGLSAGVAGTKLAESTVGNMVLQSITQAVMGSSGEAGAQLAAGQDFNIAEVVLEGLAEFATAPVEVTAMGVGQVREMQAKAADAEARVGLFQELSGQAVASKVRERMPEKFQHFVAAATANGPVENVFVPAGDFVQYFQSVGVDPFELVDQLEGVTRDDLDVALAGGSDLRIPTATYAAKIAGSEHDAFLMENMRFDPMDMTAREAAEFNERVDTVMQEMFDEAEDARLEDEKWRAVESKIYDDMVSRLRVAGRSTEVATTEAMIYPAFYRVMAERSGMDTEEFLARYPLPRVVGSVPQGIQPRNVDELNRTLAELRSRSGKSKRAETPLLDFIAQRGGIDDVGGELAARNAEGATRPGQRRLARRLSDDGKPIRDEADPNRYGWDDVAQAAVEAGFMADDPAVNEWKTAQAQGDRVAPDLIPVLQAAIDRELAGDVQTDERTDALDEIEAYLADIGVSLDQSDDDIRAAIEAAQGGDGRQYAQGMGATDSPAFRVWFGDSKVVGPDGEPLVVYHGTNQPIDAFDVSRGGASTGVNAGATKAFFFTDNRDVDGQYAEQAGKRVVANVAAYEKESARLQKEAARLEKVANRTGDWDAYERAMEAWETHEANALYADDAEGQNLVEAYLSIQNPMIVDFEGGRLSADRDLDQMIDEAKANGHDGLILRDLEDSPQMGVVSDQFVAFEPTQIKSVENRGTWAANDPRLLFQRNETGPLGLIQIGQDGQSIIRLFETANLSTMLHESGHYFLTVMQDLASKGEMNATTEYEAIKGWWRENAKAVAADGNRAMPDANLTADDVIRALDTGSTGDVMKDGAIDVGMQEQWARAFETYLMEGKSPSVELRGAFEKFRAWLVSIYRRLSGLNVAMSDDIRAVFDRMLATDEEITKARRATGATENVFATAEEMGLTEEEFTRFMKLRTQAEDDAKARLMREIMEPIKREREKWFKDERAKTRDEVEKNVNSSPVYRATEWMGNRRWFGDNQPVDMPDIRLSKDILAQRYGDGILKTLPRGMQTVYAVNGGLDPDDAAGWFGFDSGDQMVRAMERAPKRNEAIDAETDRVMNERHGDALNDGEIEQIALDAVHSDKKGQWIAAELKAVSEVAGVDVSLTAKDARASARQTIARMRVRDAMAANRFLAAERKAAEEAARLGAMLARENVWMNNARRRIAVKARSGMVDATARQIDQANASTLNRNETVAALIAAKRRQLMNHALYMEARLVTEEVGKAERYVQKLNKSSTREKIAGAGRRENAQNDYLAAMDDIMDRYDFRRMSGRAEERRGALNAFVERMASEGRENELSISDAVLRDASRKPYKTIPVEELRGVIDSLKNIEHIATRWNDLIDAQSQRKLDEAVTGIVAAFDANMPKRPPGRVATTGEAWRASTRKFLDLVLNASTLLREIDGFKDAGPAYVNLKAPIDAAMDRLTLRKVKATSDLEALYSVYSKEDRREMAVRVHMPALGYALSKWEKIAVALNTGNEGNMQRLTDPKVKGSLTPAQVKAVLATLDKRDADFIQSVWDYVGSFRDDIAAREKRATGVEPAWVEATPVMIGDKMLKGGYYPLKYDPRLSSLAKDDEFAEALNGMASGRFGKAQTRRGHLEARAKSSGRDIELDMSVLHRHVNQVIYDLELSEPVANSWKVLQNGQVRAAFQDAGRGADFDALEAWLLDTGTGQLHASDWVSMNARRFKSNFTAAKLAFNLGTVMAQVTGLSQTMVVVGKKDFMRGVQASFRPGIGDEIASKSPFMAQRRTTFNKDIYDFYDDPKLGPFASRWGNIKKEWIGPASFWLMTKTQWKLVDIPTWLGGYEQGLRKFNNDEAKAIAHADALVKRAQASGLFSDRSAIERGSVSKTTRQNDVVRLFTTLASYMFAKFNVAYERSSVAGRTIRTEGVSLRSIQEAASWTIDMAFLFAVEAVVMGAIKGKLPSEDDDEDDPGWAKFIAKETAMGVMGTIPFVRDVASVGSGFEGGGAYGGITAEVAKPFTEIAQGELDKGFVKSVISATGLALGIPSTQINRAVDAGWRQAEGEEVSPLEYLLGKRGK